MKDILLRLVLASAPIPAYAATINNPIEFRAERSKMCDRILAGWSFKEDRDLRMYRYGLGPNFERALDSMDESDLWIDLGAGHALALKEYLQAHPNGASALAVSAQKPARYKELSTSKFRYFEGMLPGYFSMFKVERGAALVTDFLGPGFYSDDLSGIVEGSINLLKPGGLYILSGERLGVRRGRPPAVIYGKGGLISFRDYLGLVSGIEILPENGTSFEVRKLIKDPVELPKLEPIILYDGSPPDRTYRVIE